MPAMPTLKIDNARYVVTVDPQRRIIQGGSVLIEDGRIRQVARPPSWPAPAPTG